MTPSLPWSMPSSACMTGSNGSVSLNGSASRICRWILLTLMSMAGMQ